MRIILALPFLFLAACGLNKQKIETTVPFDKEQASIINKRGSADITGQAFLRRRDGVVVTCAGQEVSLFPVTEYANQRMLGIYGSTVSGYRAAITANYDNADSQDYYDYHRVVICDADGNFQIENVANGEYYLTAAVMWQISDYYYEGGYLMQRVKVSGGKSQKILLSK